MFAGNASAATVTFTDVKGTWSSAVGGVALTYAGNGTDNAQVRWGIPSPTFKSGYNFVGSDFSTTFSAGTPSSPGSSGVFNIGTFEHVNFPIESGGAITAINLLFSAKVDVDGMDQGVKTFSYNFSHHETPNADEPCAYGGANTQGININGCADRVQMNFNSISETFLIGGNNYTLDLAGFLVAGNPTSGFLTMESATNQAFIQGKVELYSVAAGVPEPATWAMMIMGFGLTGSALRKRRTMLAA